MFIDELREKIKSLEPDIAIIKEFWKNSGIDAQLGKLEERAQDPNFWQETELLKKQQKLKSQKEQFDYVAHTFDQLSELIELFATDEAELKNISVEINQLTKSVAQLKVAFLLDKPEDTAASFLNINAGAGGTESQDWASMLLRMYTRFCEREGFTADIIDYQAGETAGIKSATLFIKGKNAYGMLKSEHGIHRLVRISPFDANKRRHTSFAGVSVIAEVPDVEITIDLKDLRIDTYRAGGAGGQHVNKTESAVRITHIPSGIVTQCQNERSQIQNRETAMKMLRAKLAQKQKEEQEAALAKIEKKKIEWGSQIRSYVLHPYKMVKDHRTEYESPQPDIVLDGDLIPFIEKFLVWNKN
jgi:peptide chain release factor 2